MFIKYWIKRARIKTKSKLRKIGKKVFKLFDLKREFDWLEEM